MLKTARQLVGAVVAIGLVGLAVTVLSNDAIPIELTATSVGQAAVSWSVGPVHDDSLTQQPPQGQIWRWHRQAGAQPGDLVVVVVKSPSTTAQVTCGVARVGRGGRPMVRTGFGNITCEKIINP
jgi:hypothetical protein